MFVRLHLSGGRLLTDNACVGIVAVGMTFAIL
jgi:hypothetical protein